MAKPAAGAAKLREQIRAFRVFKKKHAAARTFELERALLEEFASYLGTTKGSDDGDD